MLLAVGVFLKEGRQVHKPFGWRVAVSTGLLLYRIIALCLSKWAVQPVSHSLPTETRELWILGKTWAVFAVGGRGCKVWRGRVVVEADVMVEASGSFTVMGAAGEEPEVAW